MDGGTTSPPIEGLSFFSTEGGQRPVRTVGAHKPASVARTDPKGDGLAMIRRLRERWPHFCNGVFAPWDIRWFFDYYDFIEKGGHFLYTDVISVMQKENERNLEHFAKAWSDCQKPSYHMFHTLRSLDLDQMFHHDDFDKWGRGFLTHAQQYICDAFDRAFAAANPQAPAFAPKSGPAHLPPAFYPCVRPTGSSTFHHVATGGLSFVSDEYSKQLPQHLVPYAGPNAYGALVQTGWQSIDRNMRFSSPAASSSSWPSSGALPAAMRTISGHIPFPTGAIAVPDVNGNIHYLPPLAPPATDVHPPHEAQQGTSQLFVQPPPFPVGPEASGFPQSMPAAVSQSSPGRPGVPSGKGNRGHQGRFYGARKGSLSGSEFSHESRDREQLPQHTNKRRDRPSTVEWRAHQQHSLPTPKEREEEMLQNGFPPDMQVTPNWIGSAVSHIRELRVRTGGYTKEELIRIFSSIVPVVKIIFDEHSQSEIAWITFEDADATRRVLTRAEELPVAVQVGKRWWTQPQDFALFSANSSSAWKATRSHLRKPDAVPVNALPKSGLTTAAPTSQTFKQVEAKKPVADTRVALKTGLNAQQLRHSLKASTSNQDVGLKPFEATDHGLWTAKMHNRASKESFKQPARIKVAEAGQELTIDHADDSAGIADVNIATLEQREEVKESDTGKANPRGSEPEAPGLQQNPERTGNVDADATVQTQRIHELTCPTGQPSDASTSGHDKVRSADYSGVNATHSEDHGTATVSKKQGSKKIKRSKTKKVANAISAADRNPGDQLQAPAELTDVPSSTAEVASFHVPAKIVQSPMISRKGDPSPSETSSRSLPKSDSGEGHQEAANDFTNRHNLLPWKKDHAKLEDALKALSPSDQLEYRSEVDDVVQKLQAADENVVIDDQKFAKSDASTAMRKRLKKKQSDRSKVQHHLVDTLAILKSTIEAHAEKTALQKSKTQTYGSPPAKEEGAVRVVVLKPTSDDQDVIEQTAPHDAPLTRPEQRQIEALDETQASSARIIDDAQTSGARNISEWRHKTPTTGFEERNPTIFSPTGESTYAGKVGGDGFDAEAKKVEKSGDSCAGGPAAVAFDYGTLRRHNPSQPSGTSLPWNLLPEPRELASTSQPNEDGVDEPEPEPGSGSPSAFSTLHKIENADISKNSANFDHDARPAALCQADMTQNTTNNISVPGSSATSSTLQLEEDPIVQSDQVVSQLLRTLSTKPGEADNLDTDESNVENAVDDHASQQELSNELVGEDEKAPNPSESAPEADLVTADAQSAQQAQKPLAADDDHIIQDLNSTSSLALNFSFSNENARPSSLSDAVSSQSPAAKQTSYAGVVKAAPRLEKPKLLLSRPTPAVPKRLITRPVPSAIPSTESSPPPSARSQSDVPLALSAHGQHRRPEPINTKTVPSVSQEHRRDTNSADWRVGPEGPWDKKTETTKSSSQGSAKSEE